MNYQKIYDDICKRGQERILSKEIYTEKHHIVPKCMNGTNEKSNLTVLTAREHFLVHYILTRIYPDNVKLWYACFSMCHATKNQKRIIPNSKLYEEIRTNWSKLNRGEQHHSFGATLSDARKIQIGEYFKNNNPNSRKCSINGEIYNSVSDAILNLNLGQKIITNRLKSGDVIWEKWIYLEDSKIKPETCKKMSNAKIGSKHTIESREKMGRSGELNHFYGKNHTDETKQLLSILRLGSTASLETRQKLSDLRSGEKHPLFGITGSNHPLFGYKHSEQFCKDISERMSGEKNPSFGTTKSLETRQKISENTKGERNPFFGKNHSDELMYKIILNNPNRKPCSINGVKFITVTEASRHLNKSYTFVDNKLKSDKEEWKDWIFINKTEENNL